MFQWLYGFKRWMYRTGRPGRLARAMNWSSAVRFSAGLLSPKRAVTPAVRGRRTGRAIQVPVVVTDYDGERYLVSMLGTEANWVRNVRAAERAPILRRYLALAPGARPHVPVDRDAPLAEFARIAERYPVFRIA
jgi:hypothetical protein